MLGVIFYIALLLINAVAVLNEQRFLAQIGLASANADPQSFRYKVITLIQAVRTLLRIPLVVVNIMVIVYELLLGG